MKYIEFEFKGEIQKIWAQKLGEKFWFHLKGRTFIYNPYRDVSLKKKMKENEKKEERSKEGREVKEEEKKVEEEKTEKNGFHFQAPLPGKVIKIFVKPRDFVEKGDRVLILEAMKMEYNLKAEREAQVIGVHVSEGDFVEVDEKLILFEEKG